MKKIFKLIGFTLLLALPVIFWWQRQNIFDWWRLRDYSPPARIAELASNTSMTSSSQRLFYVYHPNLQDKLDFNSSCGSHEHSIVLGCYVRNDGIYIYDVQDPRLSGIHEVTAAHEMLHAAYDRLSGSDKQRINKLLQTAFAGVSNARIKTTVDQYRARDPNVVPDELHSILGTEVRNLPAELENYYKRYFNNRQLTVGYSEQYEQVFTERENRAKALAKEIDRLGTQLKRQRAELEQQEVQLQSEAERLERLRNNDQIEEYNAAVPAYNARVVSLRNGVSGFNRNTEHYNSLIKEYNQISTEQKELNKSLDSRL